MKRSAVAVVTREGNGFGCYQFLLVTKLLFGNAPGDRFIRGIVLHCGQDAFHFSPRFTALPVGMLWG